MFVVPADRAEVVDGQLITMAQPFEQGITVMESAGMGAYNGVFTCLSQLFVSEDYFAICKVRLLSYSRRLEA